MQEVVVAIRSSASANSTAQIPNASPRTKKMTRGTEPVPVREEGSMELIHDLFRAFVKVLDNEHSTRRLCTYFK